MQITGFLRQRGQILALLLLLAPCPSQADSADLELSRSARPWEFFCAVGTRAGLFGNEGGNLEAWVYPLKLFRNFHLRFLVDGRSLPAESLVRTVSVRPEASSILYTGDTFSVKETLFVPVKEPGAVIIFQVETAHPLEIEAVFERDFQLEWPAAMGGTYSNWEPVLRAFSFGEEQKKYVAIVGSPTAEVTEQEYQTNYSSSQDSGFRLGVTNAGKETKIIAIAASLNGRAEAEAELFRRPDIRYEAERQIEIKAELPLGTVTIHCPNRTTARKIANVLLTKPGSDGEDEICKLKDIGSTDSSILNRSQSGT